MNLIDIHTHFLPRTWPDLSARFGTPDWPWMKHLEADRAMLMVGEKEFRPVDSACWDPAVRLEAMDQVPLQDTDLACRELSRAMTEGHVGVHIGNHVGERELDDQGIITFLEHCAAEGAAVFVHPWDMMAPERMSRYQLPWLVAMPAETQLSILWLILSGAFERLPRSLRLCFAHGGGSFPYLLGRVDNAWRNRDIVREDCPRLPSSYVDRFHVDAAVFSGDALAFLVKTMGEDRVMLGSDYPFPLGEQRVGSLIRSHETLPAAAREKLLQGNARTFFGLDARRSTASQALTARRSA